MNPSALNPIAIFFVQACLVVGTPLVLWRGLRMGGIVPLVVMQIAGGIVLGPSVLGVLWPENWQLLFGAQKLTALSGLQWLAVVLFAFLSGLHIGGPGAGGMRRIAISAAVGCVALPFVILIGLIVAGQWKMLGAYAAAGLIAVVLLSVSGSHLSAPRWHFDIPDRLSTMPATPAFRSV